MPSNPQSEENKRDNDIQFFEMIFKMVDERLFRAYLAEKNRITALIQEALEKEERKSTVVFEEPKKPLPRKTEALEKKVDAFYEKVFQIMESFTKAVQKAAAVAQNAAVQLVKQKLPTGPTQQAALAQVNHAYHVPHLMQVASQVLKPTPAKQKGMAYDVAHDHDLLKGAHDSKHDDIRTAKAHLAALLAGHHEKEEFFTRLSHLINHVAHAKALKVACDNHPLADHKVVAETATGIFRSHAHQEFMQTMARDMHTAFQAVQALGHTKSAAIVPQMFSHPPKHSGAKEEMGYAPPTPSDALKVLKPKGEH